jgi:hypothetical protein
MTIVAWSFMRSVSRGLQPTALQAGAAGAVVPLMLLEVGLSEERELGQGREATVALYRSRAAASVSPLAAPGWLRIALPA